MKISDLETDPIACEEGTWVSYVGDVKLKIARFNNKKHTELSRKLSAPYRTIQNNGGKIEEDVIEEIAAQCIAEAILIDWKNLEDDNGLDTPYSPANAREIFTKIPELLNFVVEVATNAARFRKSALENAAKN